MTDLQNFIIMIATSENDEVFSKVKSQKETHVKTRGITSIFDENGKYRYMTANL